MRSSAGERARKPSRASLWQTARHFALGFLVLWQCYSMARLGVYTTHLRDARDRHAELQDSLAAAQAALAQTRNATHDCAAAERDHTSALAKADRARVALQMRLQELGEMNSWLNITAAARAVALHEQGERWSEAETEAMALKEQLNLVKGQLLTAQQQQGTLHGGGGRKKGGHH